MPEPSKNIWVKPVAMRDDMMQVIRRYDRATNTYDEDHVEIGRGHLSLPYDLPAHLFVDRLLKVDPESIEEINPKGKGNQYSRPPIAALAGWTLTVDVYGFGVKFYIRIGRDGTLKLFSEDTADGLTKIEEWTRNAD